jgi:tetratricopeptide (TPR) repeat protein
MSGCYSRRQDAAAEHNNRGNKFYERGDLEFYERGDLDRAIAEFDKAIAINPNQPRYYFNRGNARKDKREIEQAISDYNKAISMDANIPDVYDIEESALCSR